ncbi:MAG: hypothetical protein HS104_22040 [Polyangiaceae bacterium]|nr:hypothetical protein [Polyangiaceae bacterium]MCE7892055.1 hypothetical protein [Sorangiineae bacterium PRO1]MCL4749967.1 hypothetical protein [Myxococcales bacterium]
MDKTLFAGRALRSAFSLALPLALHSAPAWAQGEPDPVPAPPPPEPEVQAPREPAPAPAPPADPPAAPAQVVAALAPSPPPKRPPAPSKNLSVGQAGFLQPGALLQGWLFVPRQEGVKAPSTFRLRRAELRIKGEIVPKRVGYQLMLDAAKVLDPEKTTVPTADGSTSVSVNQQPAGASAVSILQDFFVTFLSDYADVSLGQFKMPVSWEGYSCSSSKLLFPERAAVARKYGDKRDIGLRIDKKLFDERLYYSLSVLNGEGQNRADSNNQKDVGLRVEARPIEEIMLGVVGYLGVTDRDRAGTKDRVEGDFRVEAAAALFQAEYIRAWDVPATGAPRVQGQGFYAAAGYTFFDRLQPVARLGFIDPNVDASSSAKEDETWVYEGGLNYYVQKHEAKLQASYSVFDYELAKTRHELILAAQVSF